MKLLHLSTAKDYFGIYTVCVQIDDKKQYSYDMKSEYDVEQFLQLLRHKPGKALGYLKKYCIKEEL